MRFAIPTVELFVMLAVSSAVFAAGDAPATQPATIPGAPASEIEVQEWVILVCDPAQSQANARAIFNNTLPELIGTRRTAAPEKERNQPRPIGVIRLYGAEGAPLTDVLLEMKGGSFIAHWPRTQPRVNRLLWRNIALKDGDPTLAPLAEHSWLRPLRAGESAYLTTDRGNERFLLYDVELPYKAPLKLEKGKRDGAYSLTNTGGAALHDVTVYKPAGETWMRGTLKAIDPRRATSKPSTQPVAAATTPATAPVTAPAEQDAPAAVASAESAATTTPATASTDAATTQPAGVPLTLAAADGTTLLDEWKQVLTDAGLRGTDHDLILSILREQLNSRHATIIYRLDPGELDRLLPIEVVPMPAKITRVALVVARNMDPALIDEIDTLIAQLGDDDWNTREAAFKNLAAYGAAAQPKLTAALKNEDLEIVYRVERLLAQLSQPQPPPP